MHFTWSMRTEGKFTRVPKVDACSQCNLDIVFKALGLRKLCYLRLEIREVIYHDVKDIA